MSHHYIEDKLIANENFSKTSLAKGDYENCCFNNCQFLGVRLSYFNFIDCQFKDCDFSNAILTETGFKTVLFKDCKLIGLRFDSCNSFLFAAEFIGSIIDYSSFNSMNAKKVSFMDCSLIEVDFTAADLTGISFSNCNLQGAIFENSRLEKTDFRSAINFSIDPSNNQIRKAKFSIGGLKGLLEKYDLEIE